MLSPLFDIFGLFALCIGLLFLCYEFVEKRNGISVDLFILMEATTIYSSENLN